MPRGSPRRRAAATPGPGGKEEERLTSQESRRRLILSILKEERIHSQEELQRRLKQIGMDVTQATLSRDLKFLGVARVPDSREGYVYAVQDSSAPVQQEPYLLDDIKRSIIDIRFSGNLAVVKTKLGHGHSVAYAIDRLGIPEVMGTVGGEDTLLVILEETADRMRLLRALDWNR